MHFCMAPLATASICCANTAIGWPVPGLAAAACAFAACLRCAAASSCCHCFFLADLGFFLYSCCAHLQIL